MALLEPPVAPLELTLANERASIERAHEHLDAYLGPGVAARPAAATRMVVEEMIMNAICYAYPQGGRHEIRLTVSLEENDVVIQIVDDGVPFDPFAKEPPPAARSLSEATIGGRGLRLVRNATRSRAYRRVGDRNVVELRIPR